MPASRIKYYAVGSDRMPMESNEGYYKKINLMQSIIEEVLNPQLFSTFGDVKFVFRRAYKRDESREADIVAKLVGRPVMTINEARVLLGKLPIDKAEYDEIPKTAVGGGIGFNPTGFNRQKEPKSQSETEDINSKAPDERNDGIINRIFKSISGLIGKNNVEKGQFLNVPYDKFVTIVESTGYGIHNAKIFYNENESQFELYFSDGIFAYKTVVDKTNLPDIEGFRVSNLSNAIPAKVEGNKIEVTVGAKAS